MHTTTDLYYRTSSPMTFLTWLENQETISQDYSENLRDYQDYVSSWHRFNKSTEEQKKDSFASLYVDLLRDISLTYSTEEEKRFISNCDFTKPEELDIILPFFIQKLKTIILYYSNKREDLRKQIKNLTKKGTQDSASELVKDIIIEEIEADALQVVADTRFNLPSVASVTENLKIKIEENYDDTNYFNKKSNIDELNINADFYINFKQAVITAIKKYPIFLEGINSTFSLNLQLSGTEYNLLKKRDFINYLVNPGVDNLKLLLYRDLAVKFMGCDMYYLSTGSTKTDFVTGRLFNTLPLSGNVVLNPVNKRYPTFAAAPSLSDLYTAYEVGGFFTPNSIGALEYNSFEKTFTVNTEKLKENTMIVYPDPSIVGNVVDDVGNEIKDYPLTYQIDVSWNKQKRQDAFKFGDVISEPLFYHFYPYESYSTTIIEDNTGLSSPYDDLTFWGGERDSFWTNSDVWPGLKELEKLPIDERLKSLLIDEGIMVKWFTDVFGNEYGLYKKQTDSIYEKRTAKGTIYIKTTDNKINRFVDVYNTVFSKLPAFVANEILEPINLLVLDNTILIETQNYVIIDIVKYDFETSSFISSFYPGFYRKKYSINHYLEKFIGYTYRPDNNSLYLCFTTLNPALSVSNYKSILPLIFKVDIGLKRVFTVYPGPDSTAVYSLSTNTTEPPFLDIRYVESGHFSFKEKMGIYNLSYLAYNLNNIPFLVNERFYSTPNTETFVSTNPILFKPFLYIYDTNFTYHDIKSETGFVSQYTDWAGSYNIEHFKFHKESENEFRYNYLNTTLINQTGSRIINFDWTKYDVYNLNVGCSSFGITNAGNFLLFNRNNKILNEPGREYLLFDFYKGDYVISTFGKILPNNNLNQLQITVRDTFYRDITATNVQPFTAALCNEFSNLPSYNLSRFENSMAVGTIDPIFINKTGTTYLYFNWDEYNSTNIFIGCSSFNFNLVQDVLLFSSPVSSYLITDEDKWYDLVSFKLYDRDFFTKAKIHKNTDRSLLEFYVGEILTVDNNGVATPPYSGIFCDTIFSIFKTVDVIRTGDGLGYVKSDPSCVDCGSSCTFLYPVGSTVVFKASAGFESAFTGWLGSDCDGAAGDCILTITESTTITAVFTKLPRYNVSIYVNVTGANVSSLDGVINCNGIGECNYSYLGGTPVTVQATSAAQGLTFRGFVGGSCDPESRTCSFYVNTNKALTAVYEPAITDIMIENVFRRSDGDDNMSNKAFYIIGRNTGEEGRMLIATRYPGFEDNPNRGAAICGHVPQRSPGSLICSLCRHIPIDFFHVYEMSTNTYLTLSAPVYWDKYLFGGYLGDRCESGVSDFCLFYINKYAAITGLYVPPTYLLDIVHYPFDGNRFKLGNVTLYDNYYGNRTQLECNSFQPESNCVGFYLSGTAVGIRAIPDVGSFVHLLCTSSGFFLSSTNITGTTGISGSFYIENMTTLSAISEVVNLKTLTIYKSSYPSDLFNTVLITPGPSATPSFTLANTEPFVALQYPQNTKITILPQSSNIGKPTTVIGYSALKYFFENVEGSGIYFDPDPSEFTQQTTLLATGPGINLDGSTGPLLINDSVINLTFRESELLLTHNAEVSCIFVPTV